MRIITLITDFGHSDAYVGIMKGVILSIAPHVVIVDLCHQVPPQDVRVGAFTLYQSVPFFLPDAVHVVVVDPGVGSERPALAVRTDHGMFVAPDNGVLGFVLASTGVQEAVSLTNPDYRLPAVSNTFHGRDVFAPAAAYLVNDVPMAQMGSPAANLVALSVPQPEIISSQRMIGHVIHNDRFGNLVLDVTADHLGGQATFELAGHIIDRLSRTFADGEPGELVAYVGSTYHHVEIAIRNGNAAQALGVDVGTPVLIRREVM